MRPSSHGRPFYSGVFIVSAALMALQVLQSRIFSVTTWYHLAFLVISVVMFGLTLGALHVHKGDEKKQKNDHAALMARHSFFFAIYVVIALFTQMFFPIVSGKLSGTLITLPLVSFFTVLPYYQAGIVLSLALTRTPYPVGRTYGIDLLGAAGGCLLALGLMKTMDTPSAVLVLSLAGLAASFCFSRAGGKNGMARTQGVFGAFLLLLVALNVLAPRPVIYPVFVKNRFLPQSELAYDAWNPISRVTVNNESADANPFIWGRSPLTPRDMKSSYYALKIDGDAGTPINRFDDHDWNRMAFLPYDVTTVAYSLPRLQRGAIIGVGGGRDVLSARYFGVTDITALDVNPVQIDLLTKVEPFRSYAGLHDLPGLRLINAEARSWFTREHESLDIIQMSLIDTWAATAAGAFALTENGLYTVDAWKIFLDDLNDSGVLTVSRWYLQDAHSETVRLVSLAAAAALESGAANPADHIFVATGGRIATLVLAKKPFTERQLDALHARAQQMEFGVIVSPRVAATGDIGVILSTHGRAELEAFARNHPFDIAPPTDERPFFFNQVRLNNPAQVIKLVALGDVSTFMGQARATLNLYLILLFSAAMVAGVILYPLRGALKKMDRSFIVHGTAWFMLIGFGFMLIEIALLQRMGVFLGHPVYGLGIVLFSLVLSTGLGSLLSERLPLDNTGKRMTWIILTALMAAAQAFLIPSVFAGYMEESLLFRIILCVGMTLPLGVLLGFGFPTGMALVRKVDTKSMAWFWGINGAAGVTGSALAMAMSIAMGIQWTMLCGAACYALLAVPASRLQRR